MPYSPHWSLGTGQLLFGSAGNFANKIIGGWQLSGISSFQTGQPFSVTYTARGSPVGQVSGRANRVSGVPLYPASQTRAQWFNPAAFTTPPLFTSGGNTYDTYGNSGYNMLWGPHYQDWDMNLEKNTIWRERDTGFSFVSTPSISSITPTSALRAQR